MDVEKKYQQLDPYKMRKSALDDVDQLVSDSAYEAHKRIELMYRSGQTEMFKDERFVQFILYQVFCEKFGINSPAKADRVVLEFPAKLLQPFKPAGMPGKPRALDFAISPRRPLTLDDKIPIAIEMKLGANCYTPDKMAAIQSDLIRLSFLRQRRIIEGPSAEKAYFIMFGLREELDGLCFPGLSENDQKHEDEFRYRDVPFCWSLPISSEEHFNKKMVKDVFLDPRRAGLEEGFDIVDEVCIKLLADTTSGLFSTSFEDPKAFETGVQVWMVHMPDISKGFIIS